MTVQQCDDVIFDRFCNPFNLMFNHNKSLSNNSDNDDNFFSLSIVLHNVIR